MIDLLSNDIERMELAPQWFLDMMSLTYSIPVVILLFINLFQWRSLAGMLFLVGFAPYFIIVSNQIGKLRRQTALVSDESIAIMNKLVSGMRSVKTQAREENYEESVKEIRRKDDTSKMPRNQ